MASFSSNHLLDLYLPKSLGPLNVNKQRNSTTLGQHIFTEIVYLKQRQVDMLSLVFKKLNCCQVTPISWGVSPLATSHTVEHLSSIRSHGWSHVKQILYLIANCLNKIDIAWNP